MPTRAAPDRLSAWNSVTIERVDLGSKHMKSYNCGSLTVAGSFSDASTIHGHRMVAPRFKNCHSASLLMGCSCEKPC